jgi:hypothetical protein
LSVCQPRSRGFLLLGFSLRGPVVEAMDSLQALVGSLASMMLLLILNVGNDPR